MFMIKNIYQKIKKWFIGLIIGGVALGASINIPIIPVEMQWLGSYEQVINNNLPEDSWNNSPKRFVHVFKYNNDIVEVEISELEYRKLAEKGARQPEKKKFYNIIKAIQKTNAAISLDSTANGVACSACTSITYSHTVSGADRYLFVNVAWGSGSSPRAVVSSVTYNGVALSKIRADNTGGSTTLFNEIYGMTSPTTGTNNVVITMDKGVRVLNGGSISLTGVDQTSPVEANSGTSLNNQTNISTAITTITDGAWVLAGIGTLENLAGCTKTSSQTEFYDTETSYSSYYYGGGGSYYGPKSPAGSVTMSWSLSGYWADSDCDVVNQSVAVIKPSGGSSPPAATQTNQQSIYWFD